MLGLISFESLDSHQLDTDFALLRMNSKGCKVLKRIYSTNYFKKQIGELEIFRHSVISHKLGQAILTENLIEVAES